MPVELLLLGAAVVAALAFGVPVIRRNVMVPAEMETRIVRDEELTPRQRGHYGPLDVRLEKLGYSPLLNFAATNLDGGNINRVYRSEQQAALLHASCLKTTTKGALGTVESGQTYLEWATKFEDGTTLLTNNAQLSSLFERMPHQVVEVLPAIGDVERLKQRHDRRVEELRHKGERWPQGRDVVAELVEFHRRWIDFHVSRGALRWDATAQVYRPTTKLAVRGVAAFFNPLRDNFSLARLFLGLAAGVGTPWLGELAMGHWPTVALLSGWLGSTGRVAFVVPAVAFTIAGAAVGWLFTNKSFIWAFLLGFIAVRVVGVETTLLMPLWMGVVADRLGALRAKRAVLV